MFDIGAGELIGLLVLGLLLFGPDRLPAIATDLARVIRRVRSFASSASSELKENLGPELSSLADLRREDRIEQVLLREEPKSPTIDPDAT